MILLLYLIVNVYYNLNHSDGSLSEGEFSLLYTKLSLWAFLFGVLMEWNGISRIIQGEWKFNWVTLIPTAIISILVFIPNFYWVKWYGAIGPEDFFLNIFQIPETHIILAVLAGTLLVRSFEK